MIHFRRQCARLALAFIAIFLLAALAQAAPFAALVMDARNGEVLYEKNADTRLHPASLTKMMTLYVTFQAIEAGEISIDRQVTISANAAAEPPSRLGLRKGQKIAVRYLIRAAAVKSANDAATALGEAVSGSEAAFAERMNRTARALGMTSTTFRNAHGLTAAGHLSTARDMTILGRRLFYDFPQYYNIFSRQSTHAGLATVNNTNRRFLAAYRGADGIKTGYTNAAGFNLVASAQRGQERLIATVFGGTSTAARNAKVAELLDLGFGEAPSRVAVQKPAAPNFEGVPAGKTLRVLLAVARSPRPAPRPLPEIPVLVAGLQESISSTLEQIAQDAAVAEAVLPDAGDPVEAIAPAIAAAVESVVEGVTEGVVAEGAVALAEAGPPAPVPAPAPVSTPAPAPAEVADRAAAGPAAEPAPVVIATGASARAPRQRPEEIALAAAVVEAPGEPEIVTAEAAGAEIVTRLATDGARGFAISVGRFGSRYQAERVLLETALLELGTLDRALRKVDAGAGGFEAKFVGLSKDEAALACRRLTARNLDCATLAPGGA